MIAAYLTFKRGILGIAYRRMHRPRYAIGMRSNA
jgi:hypothetical protein